MRESKIEKYLDKRVREIGGLCRKVAWVNRDGAPDRCVMMPYRTWRGVPIRTTYWVELKAEGLAATFPNNAHERKQARAHQRMRAAGQSVSVLDSFAAVDGFIDMIEVIAS